MRFATNFKYQNLPMNDKADEFNIFYSKEDNSLNALVDFIAAYKNKQVNIRFRNAIDVKIASTLAKLGDDLLVVVHIAAVNGRDIAAIPPQMPPDLADFLIVHGVTSFLYEMPPYYSTGVRKNPEEK